MRLKDAVTKAENALALLQEIADASGPMDLLEFGSAIDDVADELAGVIAKGHMELAGLRAPQEARVDEG